MDFLNDDAPRTRPCALEASLPEGATDFDPVLTSGATLGSWRVVELLGEGGMGRVYLAEHITSAERVAIKVLRRALAHSPALVERFFVEAHAVNRVRHPGIVKVTDFFVDGGTPCLVMELLEGRTLAAEMTAVGIDPARVASIGADVALALEAAHQAGVIHRDLKPDNLFLLVKDGVGSVKVLDFGVAKLMDPMPTITVHTVAGSIMGTPDYMAPEQLAGKPVDARADIYALGASLYHACTGRPPFQASNFGDLVVMHMTTPPPPPSCFASVPVVLEQVLLAMLEKDPDRRPQTMGDVALLLRTAQKLGGALSPLAPGNGGTPTLLPVGSFIACAAPLPHWPSEGAALPEVASDAASRWSKPVRHEQHFEGLHPHAAAPRAAPIWATVAVLLCAAVGGSAWALAWHQQALMAGAPPHDAAPVNPGPLPLESMGDERTVLLGPLAAAPAKLPPAPVIASASLTPSPDANVPARPSVQSPTAPAKRVAWKGGHKGKKGGAKKATRSGSTIAQRRALLDPFGKQ